MSTREHAEFDDNDHAWTPGWATYQTRRGWRGLRCRLFGHAVPDEPWPANGHAPNNYARCRRCKAPLKWFRRGQHRHGGIDANLTA